MFKYIISVFCTLFISVLATKCGVEKDVDVQVDNSPIDISSPRPSAKLQGVTLNEDQVACVRNGNDFSFRCLKAIFENSEGENIVYSPLSLQYALAMAANGADEEVARVITETIGCGDIQSMNSFMTILLNQLPALDPNVELKVTDAVLINDKFKADASFKSTMNNVYYAPVEYVSLRNPEIVLDRINEWASRNTNGLINPFLYKSDIGNDLLAILMNALYFKAPWNKFLAFVPELALKDSPFYLADGGTINVDYMYSDAYLNYSRRAGYEVLELPYAGNKYAFYVLLPDGRNGLGIQALFDCLSADEWEKIIDETRISREVVVFLPSFEISKRYQLKQALVSLGVGKAFSSAGFDRMILKNNKQYSCDLSEVIQKSRIKVTEWGTEAAAVTADLMIGDSGIERKPTVFKADHPFAFVIVEKTSGVILFEGVFTGKE